MADDYGMSAAVKSPFRGVSWKESCGKWAARIHVGGKQRRLGYFDDERSAAEAYDRAAREALGEFALLNFPAEHETAANGAAAVVGREEVCRIFGITSATLKRWERRGLVPRGKRPDGRVKLYRRAELERLLEEFGALSPPYPDPDRPGCWRVPLGGFDMKRHEAIIDAESLPLVQGRSFYWNTGGGYGGYVSLARKGETTPLHRMILGISDPALQIVHRNGDPLDCRRENLLVKTHAQKARGNRKAAMHAGRPCTSRFKGVCWDKSRETWIAYIRADGRHRQLGRFRDELAAAEAYDEAARELFGEHARLNFPDGIDAALDFGELSRAARAA